jgi:hypothetical protein
VKGSQPIDTEVTEDLEVGRLPQRDANHTPDPCPLLKGTGVHHPRAGPNERREMIATIGSHERIGGKRRLWSIGANETHERIGGKRRQGSSIAASGRPGRIGGTRRLGSSIAASARHGRTGGNRHQGSIGANGHLVTIGSMRDTNPKARIGMGRDTLQDARQLMTAQRATSRIHKSAAGVLPLASPASAPQHCVTSGAWLHLTCTQHDGCLWHSAPTGNIASVSSSLQLTDQFTTILLHPWFHTLLLHAAGFLEAWAPCSAW